MGKNWMRAWWAAVALWVGLWAPACDDGTTSGTGGGGGTSGGSGGSSSGQAGSSNQGGSASSNPCASCSGCCDGTTCLPLASQSKLSCGKSGSKCQTCEAGETCEAGACIPDKNICSPKSCPNGCCDTSGECILFSSWTSCSKGGVQCAFCEPYALCENKVCNDSQWDSDALLDLYIDGVSVSEAQCSDIVGSPDPIVVIDVGGKIFVESCSDAYSCNFSPPLKIGPISLSLFKTGKVKFSVEDSDESVDDLCWSGAIPAPTKRDFSKLIFKPGDGSLTYHIRPAGY